MISLILVMAGNGQRMGEKINKVLMPLGDKLIYEYSLELFKKFGFEIICVINQNDDIKKIEGIKYVIGGKTRSESVYNGLVSASSDYVFIHDAARPFIKEEIINELLNKLNKDQAYLCYLSSIDTLKSKGEKNLITLDRKNIIRAVTPQCAPKDILLDSYIKSKNDDLLFTDDISLIEKYHPEVKINLIESNQENFKITTPFDYKVAKALVRDL